MLYFVAQKWHVGEATVTKILRYVLGDKHGRFLMACKGREELGENREPMIEDGACVNLSLKMVYDAMNGGPRGSGVMMELVSIADYFQTSMTVNYVPTKECFQYFEGIFCVEVYGILGEVLSEAYLAYQDMTLEPMAMYGYERICSFVRGLLYANPNSYNTRAVFDSREMFVPKLSLSNRVSVKGLAWKYSFQDGEHFIVPWFYQRALARMILYYTDCESDLLWEDITAAFESMSSYVGEETGDNAATKKQAVFLYHLMIQLDESAEDTEDVITAIVKVIQPMVAKSLNAYNVMVSVRESWMDPLSTSKRRIPLGVRMAQLLDKVDLRIIDVLCFVGLLKK